MNERFRPLIGLLPVAIAAICLSGCASNQGRPTEAQRHFAAGQESMITMLQQSGIALIRIVGPFQRPVLPWTPDMTLAEVILQAGYLESRQPAQILIQRGPTTLTIAPSDLLQGKDVPVESGDVIHVYP